MFMRFSPAPAPDAEPPVKDSQAPDQPRKRRGVTSMEYLVMISFILLALILAAQGVGVMTSGLFRNSADATAKTNEQ